MAWQHWSKAGRHQCLGKLGGGGCQSRPGQACRKAQGWVAVRPHAPPHDMCQSPARSVCFNFVFEIFNLIIWGRFYRGYIFSWVAIGCVGNDQAGLAHCPISNENTLHKEKSKTQFTCWDQRQSHLDFVSTGRRVAIGTLQRWRILEFGIVNVNFSCEGLTLWGRLKKDFRFEMSTTWGVW